MSVKANTENIPQGFEVTVLKELAGDPQPGMMWGMEMTNAIRSLEKMDMVSRKKHAVQITSKGRSFLSKLKKENYGTHY